MLRVCQQLSSLRQQHNTSSAVVLLLVTSASDLLVHTIRFCSVLFGVTSSLAVIHTICRDFVLRWRTTETVTSSRVELGGRIPAVYDQRYNCHNLRDGGRLAVVHQRPCLLHLDCCSVNSRHRIARLNRSWLYFMFSYCILGFDEWRISYRFRHTCLY